MRKVDLFILEEEVPTMKWDVQLSEAWHLGEEQMLSNGMFSTEEARLWADSRDS